MCFHCFQGKRVQMEVTELKLLLLPSYLSVYLLELIMGLNCVDSLIFLESKLQLQSVKFHFLFFVFFTKLLSNLSTKSEDLGIISVLNNKLSKRPSSSQRECSLYGKSKSGWKITFKVFQATAHWTIQQILTINRGNITFL